MMIGILMLALFVEAIVNAIKPLWTKGEGLSVSEIVSITIGVFLSVSIKINLLNFIGDIGLVIPAWVEYIFYVMTGVAIGRGPSFVHDLWDALKNLGKNKQTTE